MTAEPREPIKPVRRMTDPTEILARLHELGEQSDANPDPHPLGEPVRIWPWTPVLSALACGDENWITGALCKVVGPHELHDYDGLGDWAEPSSERGHYGP